MHTHTHYHAAMQSNALSKQIAKYERRLGLKPNAINYAIMAAGPEVWHGVRLWGTVARCYHEVRCGRGHFNDWSEGS